MKKVAMSWFLVFGVIFLAGCSQQKNSQNKEVSPLSAINKKTDSQSDKIKAPIDTSNPYDTSSWIVYTNDKHEYSFKYPNTGWFIYGDNGQNVEDSDEISISIKNAQDRNHLIEVSDQDLKSKIDEVVEMYGDAPDYNKSEVVFVGLDATQITYSLTSDGKKSSEGKVVIFSKDGKTYSLDGSVKDYERPYNIDSGIFNAILGSFKFTK